MGENHAWKGRNCFLTLLLYSSLTRLPKSLCTGLWNMQYFSSPHWRKWSNNSLHAWWLLKKCLFQRPHSSFLRPRKQQKHLSVIQFVHGSFWRPLTKYLCSFLPDILPSLMGELLQSPFQLGGKGVWFGTWTRTLWGREEESQIVHIRCRTISI